jgi:hypothetical protein
VVLLMIKDFCNVALEEWFLQMKTLRSFKMLTTTHATQCHIPEGVSPNSTMLNANNGHRLYTSGSTDTADTAPEFL